MPGVAAWPGSTSTRPAPGPWRCPCRARTRRSSAGGTGCRRLASSSSSPPWWPRRHRAWRERVVSDRPGREAAGQAGAREPRAASSRRIRHVRELWLRDSRGPARRRPQHHLERHTSRRGRERHVSERGRPEHARHGRPRGRVELTHSGTPVAPASLRLHRWLDRPLVGVGLLMAAAGFAQFSPAAALGDVAEEFGKVGERETTSEQAGLPGSVLGAGLAVTRLSALLALPLAAVADRLGRRRTILTYAAVGLVVTMAAAGSPSYWWFVAALAVARPFLTATDTAGAVLAAEHTGVADRAKAIAMASAAYGVGAGLVAILRGLAGDGLGFRPVFGLAALPLVGVAIAGGLITEPDRFARRARAVQGRTVLPVLRAVHGAHRRRLAVLATIGFASGFVTGPVGTLLFVYAENVLGVSRGVTGALVVAAGATGLAGLVLGRFLADRIGRRPT